MPTWRCLPVPNVNAQLAWLEAKRPTQQGRDK